MKYCLRSIILMVCCSMTYCLTAQNLTITGTVIDDETEEPLFGVSIVSMADHEHGTITDRKGNFTIVVNEDDQLSFSYTGYTTVEIVVDRLRTMGTIRLEPGVYLSDVPLVLSKLDYDDLYSSTVRKLQPQRLTSDDAFSLTRAFDGLPGVQVQQGALNTQRLSLRGVGARTPFATDQVRLYWNDFPITNGAGESVLEDLESGFLRTAYVQTGTAPAALGANLGGSIQLIGREWTGRNWSTSAGVMGGGFGRRRAWLNLHNQSGKWRQDVNLVRSTDDGYRENNEYARLSGTVLGRIDHFRGKTVYMFHLRQLAAEIPSSLNATDFAADPTLAAANWAAVNGREDQLTYLAGIQHENRLAYFNRRWGSLHHRTSAFGGRRTNDEVRPFNIITEDSYQLGLRTKLEFRHLTALKGSAALGGELFYENYDRTTFQVFSDGGRGDVIGTATEGRHYFFAFAEWKAQWGRAWETVLEGNLHRAVYDWQQLDIDRQFRFDPVLLPGLTVFYQLPGTNWRLHARYQRGISQPGPETTFETTFAESVPLAAVTGWNREVGGEWTNPLLKFGLTLFQMDIDNALVTRQDAEERTFFFNGGSVRHQGVEFWLDKEWATSRGAVDLRSSYTLADYRFVDFAESNQDFSGNDLPGVHPHRWRNDLVWTGDRLSTSLTVDVAAAQWADDANTTQAKGFTLLHTRIAYDLLPNLGRGLSIYAGVNNLTDTRYAAMVQVNARGFGGNLPRYFYPGLPRYFYFGIDYGL